MNDFNLNKVNSKYKIVKDIYSLIIVALLIEIYSNNIPKYNNSLYTNIFFFIMTIILLIILAYLYNAYENLNNKKILPTITFKLLFFILVFLFISYILSCKESVYSELLYNKKYIFFLFASNLLIIYIISFAYNTNLIHYKNIGIVNEVFNIYSNKKHINKILIYSYIFFLFISALIVNYLFMYIFKQHLSYKMYTVNILFALFIILFMVFLPIIIYLNDEKIDSDSAMNSKYNNNYDFLSKKD